MNSSNEARPLLELSQSIGLDKSNVLKRSILKKSVSMSPDVQVDLVSGRRAMDSEGSWFVDGNPISRGAVNDFSFENGQNSQVSGADPQKALSPTQAAGWILKELDSISLSPFIPVYLILLGLLTAAIGTSMDILIHQIYLGHVDFMNLATIPSQKIFLWIIFVNFFGFLAVFVPDIIQPNAVGSGIPEMKSMLSGVPLYRYLSVRTLIAKVVGLCCALGGGLYVGKEGPFVHISSVLANQLAKLPILRKLRYNPTLMQQMLAAACAAGVAGNSGAPIGGVLFSIEVTAAYYNVDHYWSAFLASVVSGATYRYIWNQYSGVHSTFQATFFTDFPLDISVSFAEIPVFIFLGVLGGVFGALFVKIGSFINRNRGKIPKTYFPQRARFLNLYAYGFLVSTVVGVFSCPEVFGTFMSLTAKTSLRDLFSSQSMETLGNGWGSFGGLYADLILFGFTRYILCLFCVSMSIPNGVLMPVLAMGGALGRIFGELMLAQFPNGIGEGGIIYPGGYALAGAAAFTGGVTHALSGAIILFEFTGQIVYLIPVLISALCSTGISRLLTSSVYDTGLRDKGLPWVPPLREWTSKITAGDIMTTNIHPISSDSSIGELCATLIHNNSEIIPVVSNSESVLRGCVKRTEVEDAVISYLEQVGPEFIEEAIPNELFFALSKAKIQDMLASDSLAKKHLPLFSDDTPEEVDSEPLQKTQFNNSKSVTFEEISLAKSQPQQEQQPTPVESSKPVPTFQFGNRSDQNQDVIEFVKLPKTNQQVEASEPASISARNKEGISVSSNSVLNLRNIGQTLPLFSTPIQLTESSSLATIHQLFVMNRLSCAFVTNTGVLVGLVRRSDLAKYDGTVDVMKGLEKLRRSAM